MTNDTGDNKVEKVEVQETDTPLELDIEPLTKEQWQISYDAGIITALGEEIKPLTKEERMILYNVEILNSLEEDSLNMIEPSNENNSPSKQSDNYSKYDEEADFEDVLQVELNSLFCVEDR